jgi:hypothetical protein
LIIEEEEKEELGRRFASREQQRASNQTGKST